MKKNMGQKDRVVRAMIGAVLLLFGIVFQNFIGLVGLIPLATASFGYCPLYDLLDITSNRYGD